MCVRQRAKGRKCARDAARMHVHENMCARFYFLVVWIFATEHTNKAGLLQNPPLQEVSACQSQMRRSAELKLLTLTQSLAIR